MRMLDGRLEKRVRRKRLAPLRLSGATALALALLAALALQSMAEQEDGGRFIAGVQPDRRPAGAPVLRTVDKGPEWYERALEGISEPYPASLRFLEDQGAWYTPFDHPGMTAPYDIRGLHTARQVGGTQ